jgi:hypothetical protein
MRGDAGAELAGHKTPILESRPGDCPEAGLGQTSAAPPSSVMK